MRHSRKVGVFCALLLFSWGESLTASPAARKTLRRAYSLVSAHRLPEAEREFKKAVRLAHDKHRYQRIYIQAYIKLALDDCPRAVQLYGKLLVRRPHDDRILADIADCYTGTEPKKAAAWFRKAMTAAQKNARSGNSYRAGRASFRLASHAGNLVLLARFSGNEDEVGRLRKTIAGAVKGKAAASFHRALGMYHVYRAMLSVSDLKYPDAREHLRRAREAKQHFHGGVIPGHDEIHMVEKIARLHEKYSKVKPDLIQKILVISAPNTRRKAYLRAKLSEREYRRGLRRIRETTNRSLFKRYYMHDKPNGRYLRRPGLSIYQLEGLGRALRESGLKTGREYVVRELSRPRMNYNLEVTRFFARAVEAYSHGRIRVALSYRTFESHVEERHKVGRGYLPVWTRLPFYGDIAEGIDENDILWFHLHGVLGSPAGIAAIRPFDHGGKKSSRGMMATEFAHGMDNPLAVTRLYLHEYFHIVEMRFGITPIHGGYLRTPNRHFKGFRAGNNRWREFDYYHWQLSREIPRRHSSFRAMEIRSARNLGPVIIAR